jgi:ribonuclease P protein component
MLPKPYRLRFNWEVKRVFQKGVKIKTPLFLLFYRPNYKKKSQLCVVLSRKFDKKAVFRNKIKRIYHNTLYHTIISLDKNYDIVILPRKNVKHQAELVLHTFNKIIYLLK